MYTSVHMQRAEEMEKQSGIFTLHPLLNCFKHDAKRREKVYKLYERTRRTHSQSLQPFSNSHVCVRLNQDALVSTHEFSILLILGKKESISPRLPWRSQYAVTRSCSPEEVHKSFQNDFEGGSVIAGLGADSMWEFGSWREFD